MGIQKIISSVVDKPLMRVANSKSMEKLCKQYRENNTKFITAFSVGSIVAKDGYGCYIYVKQNENNKSIPENKRKFLSGLDIATGTMMIGAQIATYATIAKKATQSKIFEKFMGKAFSEEKYKILEKKVLSKVKGSTPDKIKDVFLKTKENNFVAVNHLFALVTTTMIAKRVLVSLAATPFADWYKKTMDKNSHSTRS